MGGRRRPNAAGPTAFVTVTDDGPGFDPASALGPVDGHIGLALLADAAEGVSGRLDLRSRPGRGTTFKLSVPTPPQPAPTSSSGGATLADHTTTTPTPPNTPTPDAQADQGEQLQVEQPFDRPRPAGQRPVQGGLHMDGIARRWSPAAGVRVRTEP